MPLIKKENMVHKHLSLDKDLLERIRELFPYMDDSTRVNHCLSLVLNHGIHQKTDMEESRSNITKN